MHRTIVSRDFQFTWYWEECIASQNRGLISSVALDTAKVEDSNPDDVIWVWGTIHKFPWEVSGVVIGQMIVGDTSGTR